MAVNAADIETLVQISNQLENKPSEYQQIIDGIGQHFAANATATASRSYEQTLEAVTGYTDKGMDPRMFIPMVAGYKELKQDELKLEQQRLQFEEQMRHTRRMNELQERKLEAETQLQEQYVADADTVGKADAEARASKLRNQ